MAGTGLNIVTKIALCAANHVVYSSPARRQRPSQSLLHRDYVPEAWKRAEDGEEVEKGEEEEGNFEEEDKGHDLDIEMEQMFFEQN